MAIYITTGDVTDKVLTDSGANSSSLGIPSSIAATVASLRQANKAKRVVGNDPPQVVRIGAACAGYLSESIVMEPILKNM